MLSLAKRLEQSKRLPMLVHAMTIAISKQAETHGETVTLAAVAAGARLAVGPYTQQEVAELLRELANEIEGAVIERPH